MTNYNFYCRSSVRHKNKSVVWLDATRVWPENYFRPKTNLHVKSWGNMNKKQIKPSVLVQLYTTVRIPTYCTTVCNRLCSRQSWISRSCRSCQTWVGKHLVQGTHDYQRKPTKHYTFELIRNCGFLKFIILKYVYYFKDFSHARCLFNSTFWEV